MVRAWLDAVVQKLQETTALGRLVPDRFELRRSLEKRLAALRREARTREYQAALFGEHETVKVRVGGGYEFVYDPNAYPARTICPRSGDFSKHYYEKAGELEPLTPKGNVAEEFQCAQFLDGLAGVQWWVRNLSRQPAHSFWLQTSTDRFYPDFVAQLTNGKILVVEFKGAHIEDTGDTMEKERIGQLWANGSGGQCLFAMVRTLEELPRIQGMVQAATSCHDSAVRVENH